MDSQTVVTDEQLVALTKKAHAIKNRGGRPAGTTGRKLQEYLPIAAKHEICIEMEKVRPEFTSDFEFSQPCRKSAVLEDAMWGYIE